MTKLQNFAKAKHSVDFNLLDRIPHFAAIFSDRSLWPVIVLLSGEGGIAHFEQKHFQEGAFLIKKGQFDQMIYWVLTGRADVITMINDQPKVIHQARQGDCIGELGVLRGTVRNADVIAGAGGVQVLELDWAITEKDSDLAKSFYHLIALNLADKLDHAYEAQLKILGNSIRILQDKTAHLIEKNRKLEKILQDNHIEYGDEISRIDQEQALSHVIANIKESLSLLEIQESRNILNRLGAV